MSKPHISRVYRNCGSCPQCVDEQGNKLPTTPHGPYYRVIMQTADHGEALWWQKFLVAGSTYLKRAVADKEMLWHVTDADPDLISAVVIHALLVEIRQRGVLPEKMSEAEIREMAIRAVEVSLREMLEARSSRIVIKT
jgi:hypothetical protein